MNEKRVVMNIGPKAKVKINGGGYKGSTCEKIIHPIQAALGVASTSELTQ